MTPKTELLPLSNVPGGMISLARNEAGEMECCWRHHDEDGDWLCLAKVGMHEDGELWSKLVWRKPLEGNA